MIPNGITAGQGANGLSIVALVQSSGFAGGTFSVTGPNLLSTADGPGMIGYHFSDLNNTGGVLVLDIGANVPAGSYPITVTASAGGHTASSNLSLQVQSPSAASSYTVTLAPANVSITQGSAAVLDATAQGSGFTAGTLRLTGSSLLSTSNGPDSIGYRFDNLSALATAGQGARPVLEVGSNVPPAIYKLTLAVAAGTHTVTTPLTLQVMPQTPVPAGHVSSPTLPATSTLPAAACTPTTCTVTVDHQGPFNDPETYTMGWASTKLGVLGDGRRCFLFMFGLAGDKNNSVRCMDPATGNFSYLYKNTETQTGSTFYPGTSLLVDRDNYLQLPLPGYGLWLVGGAYLNEAASGWDGFLDFNTATWTYVDNTADLFVPPYPEFFAPPPQIPGFTVMNDFNPVESWSQTLNIGFVYGGEVGPAPTTNITLVEPRADARFNLVPVSAPDSAVPGGGDCTFVRNNGVAVGDWVYIVGGRCAYNGQTVDTTWFRRFNLKTLTWQELSPMPAPRLMPQVTYDSQNGYIVVYGGNGGAGLNNGNPGYWTGHNTVWVWNVVTQGPWQDITSLANLPYVQMPLGAYDPVTGWTCYRGGIEFDSTGNQLGANANSQVNCIRLHFTHNN